MSEEEKKAATSKDIARDGESNTLRQECRKALRKKTYDLSRTETIVKRLAAAKEDDQVEKGTTHVCEM